MPEGKPTRRRAIITITCQDDAAEAADVKVVVKFTPALRRDELSMVLSITRGVLAEALARGTVKATVVKEGW